MSLKQNTKMIASCLVILLACTSSTSQAYNLPGVAPKGFTEGQPIQVFANKIESPETALPYDYHHFDFCPVEVTDQRNIPLGQRLFGDIPELTAYPLKFMKKEQCALVCRREYTDKDTKEVNKFKNAIKDEYSQNWRIDNLDVIYPYANAVVNIQLPMGHWDKAKKEATIFNHVHFEISYHNPSPTKSLIVGAKVQLKSMKSCTNNDFNVIKFVDGKYAIDFTYSVDYKEDPDTKWASRWDIYMKIPSANIRWFSIANSMAIILVLSGFLAIILLRTVYRDIVRYNSQLIADSEEDYGWKLVHGDVFRTPNKSMLLSTVFGSGIQILLMCLTCSLFAFLHLISAQQRGSIGSTAIMFFVCMGAFGGYGSARMYKMFGGERWKSLVIATSFFIPGVIFAIFIILNIILHVEDSSNAIGPWNMFLLISLWFLGSVPLTLFGSYLGFKQDALTAPIRINPIPREIPIQTFILKPLPSILIAGVLPFGAIFTELYFLFNSLWNHRLYFLPIFLLVVFIILVVTCAEVSILLCYFQLCAEDYHWWWRSFFTASSVAIYFYLFVIYYYFVSQLQGAVSTVLYFGFMGIVTIMFLVMTGCVGVLSCYYFVHKIYSSVKID